MVRARDVESETCLGHCLTSVIELLCENASTPLRVYFHSLYSLGIILNLELHILAKLMFTDIRKRMLDPIRHL